MGNPLTLQVKKVRQSSFPQMEMHSVNFCGIMGKSIQQQNATPVGIELRVNDFHALHITI